MRETDDCQATYIEILPSLPVPYPQNLLAAVFCKDEEQLLVYLKGVDPFEWPNADVEYRALGQGMRSPS